MVSASNPKALLFFPQLLNLAAPIELQFVILALTPTAFEFTMLTTCALSVSRLAPLYQKSSN